METVCDNDERAYAASLRGLNELIRKWCGERKIPFHGIYVWERGQRNGLHSHTLLHIPHLYRPEFATWILRAIQTVTSNRPVVGVEAFPDTLRIVHRRDNDIPAQWKLFRYVMKGLDPDHIVIDRSNSDNRAYASEMLAVRPRSQGAVAGKRVGVFRSVDETAQKRFGFASLWDQGAFDAMRLLSDAYVMDFHRARKREELEAVIQVVRKELYENGILEGENGGAAALYA